MHPAMRQILISAALVLWFIRVATGTTAKDRSPVCLMYLTGQHDVIPTDQELVKPITHVVLAFIRSDKFLDTNPTTEWPLFRSVTSTRDAFVNGTKILVAIGGWGDTSFSIAARNDTSRKTFAQNVARMVEATGADGVDIDWEYPGGNGEDYKQVPNAEKEWEIDAYPLLLEEIRSAIGPDKLMTAAVPGIERDMLAFTSLTVPRIMQQLDYLNVMTYDLMNRRDTVTKHHTSTKASRDALQAYITRGAPPHKLNLGFGFYLKWYETDKEQCAEAKTPIGCKTLLLEDPVTGGDLGRAGGFSWHDNVPDNVEESFRRALLNRQYDEEDGATYYWDREQGLWWSYDEGTNGDIEKKVKTLNGEMDLAGVFAWGLGEDAPTFHRLKYLEDAIKSGDPGKEGSSERDEL